MAEKLDPNAVMRLIDRVGPFFGCDNTYFPTFPPDREDVCVVVRLAEDGRDYGYDTAYAVWLEDGNMKYKELINTKNTKDYLSVNSVTILPDGSLKVNFGSAGMFSGTPWSESVKFNFAKK